jgi:hypothetical protein
VEALMSRKSLIFTAALAFVALAWWVADLKRFYSGGLGFDDSYMFWRYALHVREGLGISWNLDGLHTYGETSLLWGLLVVVLTFLPATMDHAMMLGSWLTSGAALIVIAYVVSKNATSPFLSKAWCAFPVVALPIVASRVFLFNASRGMDTMLGMLINAVLVGAVLAWSRGKLRGEWVGVTGGLCLLARPESLLAAIVMPVLAWWLNRGVTRKELLRVVVVMALIVATDLVFAKLYFHTPLPLGFYMKSGHAYEGYPKRWHPVSFAMDFVAACGVFLAAIAMFARKRDAPLLTVCMVPAVLTFLYLCTVTQIMGMGARYYAPYFAFFAVPAALVLDRRLVEGDAGGSFPPASTHPLMRLAMVGVVLYFTQAMYPVQLLLLADRLFEGRKYAYDEVRLGIASPNPLPEQDGLDALSDVAEMLVKPLPKGATVAATEVGYMGAIAPQVNVIDMAGLNDAEIALNGFSAAKLLAREPDLIWMPHTQYTYQRGLLFTEPGLLQNYLVVDGAASYGLAIRKNSPYFTQLEHETKAYWAKRYPRNAMADYVVNSVSWDKAKNEVFEQ